MAANVPTLETPRSGADTGRSLPLESFPARTSDRWEYLNSQKVTINTSRLLMAAVSDEDDDDDDDDDEDSAAHTDLVLEGADDEDCAQDISEVDSMDHGITMCPEDNQPSDDTHVPLPPAHPVSRLGSTAFEVTSDERFVFDKYRDEEDDSVSSTIVTPSVHTGRRTADEDDDDGGGGGDGVENDEDEEDVFPVETGSEETPCEELDGQDTDENLADEFALRASGCMPGDGTSGATTSMDHYANTYVAVSPSDFSGREFSGHDLSTREFAPTGNEPDTQLVSYDGKDSYESNPIDPSNGSHTMRGMRSQDMRQPGMDPLPAGERVPSYDSCLDLAIPPTSLFPEQQEAFLAASRSIVGAERRSAPEARHVHCVYTVAGIVSTNGASTIHDAVKTAGPNATASTSASEFSLMSGMLLHPHKIVTVLDIDAAPPSTATLPTATTHALPAVYTVEQVQNPTQLEKSGYKPLPPKKTPLRRRTLPSSATGRSYGSVRVTAPRRRAPWLSETSDTTGDTATLDDAVDDGTTRSEQPPQGSARSSMVMDKDKKSADKYVDPKNSPASKHSPTQKHKPNITLISFPPGYESPRQRFHRQCCCSVSRNTPVHSMPLHYMPVHTTPLHSASLNGTSLNAPSLYSAPLRSTPLQQTGGRASPLYQTGSFVRGGSHLAPASSRPSSMGSTSGYSASRGTYVSGALTARENLLSQRTDLLLDNPRGVDNHLSSGRRILENPPRILSEISSMNPSAGISNPLDPLLTSRSAPSGRSGASGLFAPSGRSGPSGGFVLSGGFSLPKAISGRSVPSSSTTASCATNATVSRNVGLPTTVLPVMGGAVMALRSAPPSQGVHRGNSREGFRPLDASPLRPSSELMSRRLATKRSVSTPATSRSLPARNSAGSPWSSPRSEDLSSPRLALLSPRAGKYIAPFTPREGLYIPARAHSPS